MTLIIGPLFSGKRECAKRLFRLDEEELTACAVWDVQELAMQENLEGLADALAANRIVIATETGSGVIPLDAEARQRRENAGRLSCLLAERADTVIRVCCGLPQVLKGSLP